MSLPSISSDNTLILGDEEGSLVDELCRLRLQLSEREAVIEKQTLKLDALQNAIEHRDAVIGQLASSRKLVFEECHRACLSNQAELRQMQEAVHKLSRELQRARREATSSSRLKNCCTDLRRQPSMVLTLSPTLEDVPEEIMDEATLELEPGSPTSDNDDLKALSLDKLPSSPPLLGPSSPQPVSAVRFAHMTARASENWEADEEEEDEDDSPIQEDDEQATNEDLLAELLTWA